MATQTPSRPAAPTRTPAAPTEAAGNRATGYIAEVQKEMQKVSWPKRSELVNNTILTLVSALVMSLLIFLADQAISWLLSLIYG